MTRKELLEKIQGKTIGEIEEIFNLYSDEISELEYVSKQSKYDIIKYKILDSINILINNRDIEQLNLFIKNPIAKKVGNIVGNENYIQYAIYEKIRTMYDRDFLIKSIYNIQFIEDIKIDLLLKNDLLTYREKKNMLIGNIELLKKEIIQIQYKLPSVKRVTNLILSTKDIDFIKECIENENLIEVDKAKLIVSLNDKDYIKKCIESEKLININRTYLLTKVDDINYVKNCIENTNMKEIDRIKLLIYLKDINYTTNYIKNGFLDNINEYEKKDLIYNVYKDATFEDVNNILNISNLQLDMNDKIVLMLKINNKEYIENFLDLNKNKLKLYQKNILKFATDNSDYFSTQNKKNKKLTIPKDLRYGIEIESRTNRIK